MRVGRLSTHVLDTVRAKPAPDVAIDLDVLDAECAASVRPAVRARRAAMRLTRRREG
jgi:5-hydroxyisourate hydrolase-like protein (transthyretin family)